MKVEHITNRVTQGVEEQTSRGTDRRMSNKTQQRGTNGGSGEDGRIKWESESNKTREQGQTQDGSISGRTKL